MGIADLRFRSRECVFLIELFAQPYAFLWDFAIRFWVAFPSYLRLRPLALVSHEHKLK